VHQTCLGLCLLHRFSPSTVSPAFTPPGSGLPGGSWSRPRASPHQAAAPTLGRARDPLLHAMNVIGMDTGPWCSAVSAFVERLDNIRLRGASANEKRAGGARHPCASIGQITV